MSGENFLRTLLTKPVEEISGSFSEEDDSFARASPVGGDPRAIAAQIMELRCAPGLGGVLLLLLLLLCRGRRGRLAELSSCLRGGPAAPHVPAHLRRPPCARPPARALAGTRLPRNGLRSFS